MSTPEIRSCQDALRVLAALLDGELDPVTRDEVQAHLEICRSCFSRAEFEKRLKANLTDLGHEPVRPALAARIDTLIRSFAVAGGP